MELVKVVIFDIDDTLNNLVENTLKVLGIPTEYAQKMDVYKILTSKIMPKSIAKEIIAEWHKPQAFRYATPQITSDELRSIVDIPYTRVIIHSLCLTEEVKIAKLAWLSDNFLLDGIGLHLEVGEHKTVSESFVVVEDSLEYISKCNAAYKILVNKPYNSNSAYPDVDKTDITRVLSTRDSLPILRRVLTDA